MRLLKAFITGITGLFIFITLMSLLIPSNPRVSRTVFINSTTDKIYTQVSDLKNWKNWNPLFSSDAATPVFPGRTSGENALCDISYKNKIIHLAIVASDTASVTFTLKTPGENNITNQIHFSSIPSASQTKVDWIATTHLHWYPWEKFYAIFIDKLTGPGYETALNNLKLFVETKQ